MTKIEKKWITYQLLVYLEKAEKWGLFHGDLKCENVMLTSWNWIFVTDHAFCYKPLYLPAENYGGFSYFFDTSNRTCYMAPERFGGSEEQAVGKDVSPGEAETKLGEKRAKMDAFSMGCVIAELWLEQDRRLFEYGSMLRYKDGSDDPLNILQNIQDPLIRQLVLDMVKRDPDQRRSAASYLKESMGSIFPFYFEALHEAISKILTSRPDERVRRISLSLEDLHKLFTQRLPPPADADFIRSALPSVGSLSSSTPLYFAKSTSSSTSQTTTAPTSAIPSSSPKSSAPFIDAPTPFAPTPFSTPSIAPKTDPVAICTAVQALLDEDARLELAVKFQGIPFDTSADCASALLQRGHFDSEEKINALIAICRTAESLIPVAEKLEVILKHDTLFEPLRARPRASQAAKGGSRVSPVFNPDQLPKGEMKFLDGQGGLMSATLATETLLRELLSDQENGRLLREIDVNAYSSEEVRSILNANPLDIPNAQPSDMIMLTVNQEEMHCRRLLVESLAALDVLNASLPPQTEEIDASKSQDSVINSASQKSALQERKDIEQKLMIALEKLSTLYRDAEEYRRALALQNAFLGRAKHWKDSISLLRGFQQLGITYHVMREFDEAITAYKQALTFANQLRSKRHLLDLFHLLGEAYAEKSELQTATHFHRLYEELQGELKGSLENDARYGYTQQHYQYQQHYGGSPMPSRAAGGSGNAAGSNSPAFAHGVVSITTHKLLSTPTRAPGRVSSQSVSAASSPFAAGSAGGTTTSATSNSVSTPDQQRSAAARFAAATANSRPESSVYDYFPHDEPDTLGYVIVLDILCAMLPYLTDTGLKLTCLDCFVKISHYVDDEVRLQKLIPCLVSYLDSTRDPSALVRSQTIKTLAHVISLVTEFPIDDAHIFQDYLIPVLKFVLKEERETIVHQAFAAALPKLAKSALLCLNHSHNHRHQHHRSGTGGGNASAGEMTSASSSADPRKKDAGYEDDLRELRLEFRTILTEWLENASLIVKRTVLEEIGTLAEFFGSEDTNTLLLQLIFSWLNFSEWELKCAVFDNIVGLSQVAGSNAVESYIESYLPIHDESEFVIDSAVNCLASLTEAGIFSSQKLREFTIQVAPLLLHPNAWIRFATVQFLSKIARRLTSIEVQCFILPHIRRFLKHDITAISHTTLLQAMHVPVTRSAYEKAMTSLNLNSASLVPPSPAGGKHASDSSLAPGVITASPSPNSVSNNVKNFSMLTSDSTISDFVIIEPTTPTQSGTSPASATRSHHSDDEKASIDLAFSLGLAELDLEGQDEEKLFWMKEYVKEARKIRIDKRSTLITDSWAADYTRLSREKTVHDIAPFLAPLQTPASALMPSLDANGPNEPTELWKAMFGSSSSAPVASSTAPSAPSHSISSATASVGVGGPMDPNAYKSVNLGAAGSVVPVGTVSGLPASASTSSLASMVSEEDPKVTVTVGPAGNHSADFSAASSGSGSSSMTYASSNAMTAANTGVRVEPSGTPLNLGPIRASKLSTASATTGWTPQGLLVATLSEHEEAVTQLQVARDGAFFASGSHDKKVKIWDSTQFENTGPLRSVCTYHGLGSAVTSISICQDSHSVAAASIGGSIHVFRVDAGSNVPKGTSMPPGSGGTAQMMDRSGGGPNASGVVGGATGSGPSSLTPGVNTVGASVASAASAAYHHSAHHLSVVRRLDQTDGVILKVEHFEKGADSLIVYATDRGNIRSWDLRTQKEPWMVSNSPHLGLITSLLVDPQRNWLAVGTDAGNFTCWDLRFRVPLLHWSLPTFDGLCGIHTLAADPLQNGAFWASFGPGMVAHWNLQTRQCDRVLRVAPRDFTPSASTSSASSTPHFGPAAHDWDNILIPKDAASSGDDFRIADLQRPLTESARSLEAHLNTIRALAVGPYGNFALTGGADKKLRFWNFDNPPKSFILSGKDPKEDVSYTAWESIGKTVHGLEEVRTPIRESPLVAAPQQLPSSGHCDTILDTKLLELSSKKVLVVSSSRDGVIKVWK